ncbi:rRNA maturation RNase YbeY [Tepidiphilus baoligensis]|uniref:Endoribonuclease YbeY n=1 Tax=Tepidiphilus baoligensis TaxID=2698687 RepID=A0ABX1QJ30_9PROT|nr:rRNA maturation RNase YbeY [Tepidiphilus baoligensis]NMH16023.1 rRNA maturation RNase YbeY [Tepidiphilus baoligensis]
MKRLRLSYQRVCSAEVPPRAAVLRWVRAALQKGEAQVAVRFVDTEEGRELNRRFRGKDYATNVLSFVYDVPEEAGLMGDLVLCAPVVEREAAEQGKPLAAHYAHLIVHGMLHLQGYDHEDDSQAAEMEALERDVLGRLGFPDPYVDEER